MSYRETVDDTVDNTHIRHSAMRQRDDHFHAVFLSELPGDLSRGLRHRPVPEFFWPRRNRCYPVLLHQSDDADLDTPFLRDPILFQRLRHGVGVRVDDVRQQPREIGGLDERGQVREALR